MDVFVIYPEITTAYWYSTQCDQILGLLRTTLDQVMIESDGFSEGLRQTAIWRAIDHLMLFIYCCALLFMYRNKHQISLEVVTDHNNMSLVISIVFAILVSASLGAESASNDIYPTRSDIAAAETTVTSNVSYASPLFHGETIQLTDQALAAAASEIQNASISDVFSFGVRANNTSAPSRSHSCKVLPGDPSWPSDDIWETFNSLLGGSLIRPVPLAASCYADWSSYDVDICAEVSGQWLDSSLQ